MNKHKLEAKTRNDLDTIFSKDVNLGEELDSIKNSIEYTDDIGQCEGFKEIIKSIKNEDSDLKPYLPYQKFSTYDQSKDRDFVINYTHKSIKYAQAEIDKYSAMFALTNNDDNIFSFINSMNALDVSDSVIKFVELIKELRKDLLNQETVVTSSEINNAFRIIDDKNRYERILDSAYSSGDISVDSHLLGKQSQNFFHIDTNYNKATYDANKNYRKSKMNPIHNKLKDNGYTINPTAKDYQLTNDEKLMESGGEHNLSMSGINVALSYGAKVIKLNSISKSFLTTNNVRLFRCLHRGHGAINFSAKDRHRDGCDPNLGLTPDGLDVFMKCVNAISTVMDSQPYKGKFGGSNNIYIGITSGRRCCKHIVGLMNNGGKISKNAVKFSPHWQGISSDVILYYNKDGARTRIRGKVFDRIAGEVQDIIKNQQCRLIRYYQDNGFEKVTGSLEITEVMQYIRDVKDNISSLTKVVLQSVNSKIYKKLTNDVSGKVESYNLNWMPGNTIPINLEGENAPTIQSLGGRQVSINVVMTFNSPLSVAKLFGMFKVSGSIEQSLSMLMLANSIKKSGSNRYNEVYDFIAQKAFEDKLKQMQGKIHYPELGEPVEIDNQMLNSIGLKTFIPTGIELANVEGAPNHFKVSMDLMYVNTRVKYNESLKHQKNTSKHAILGVGSHITKTENKHAKFLSEISSKSIMMGFSEIISLYCLYKVRKSFELMHEYQSTDEYKELSSKEKHISMSKILSISSELDYTKLDPDLTDDINNFISSEKVSKVAGTSGVISGILSQVTALVGFVSTMSQKSLTKKGKIGLIYTAVTSALSIGGTVLTGKLGVNLSEGYNLKLQNLILMYMYDFFGDYVTHIERGDVDDFMNNISSSVIANVELNKNGSLDLNIPTIYDFDGNSSINKVNVVITNVFEKNKVSFSALGGLFTNKSSSSIVKWFGDKTEKSRGDNTNDSYPAILTYISNLIVSTSSILGKAFERGDKVDMSPLLTTAYLILNNDSHHKYSIECASSILIQSGIFDVGYAIALVSETDINNYMNSEAGRKILSGSHYLKKYMDSAYKLEILRGHIAEGKLNINNLDVRSCLSYSIKSVIIDLSRVYYGFSEENNSLAIDVDNSVYMDIYDVLNPGLVKLIFNDMKNILGVAISIFVDVIVIGAAKRIASLLASLATGATVGNAPGAVVGVVLNVIFTALDLIYLARTWLFNDVINYSTRLIKPFIIGHWMKTELTVGYTGGILLEMIEISGVWLYSVIDEEDSDDVFDPNWTSYMDYPVLLNNSKPLMPDAYMYKIGFMNDEFEELKEVTTEIIDMVKTYQSDLDGSDFKRLLDEQKYRLNELVLGIKYDFENSLKENIQEIVGNNISSIKKLGKVESTISKAMTGSSSKSFIGLDIIIKTLRNQEYVEKERYESISRSPAVKVKIDINDTGIVNDIVCVLPGDKSIVNLYKNDDFADSITNRSSIIYKFNYLNNDDNNKLKDLSELILKESINFVEKIHEQNDQISGVLSEDMPDTLNNLMFLKSLVGNSLKSVGELGISYCKNMMESVGVANLVKSARFRSNYLFPTAKLFFIEEDNEAFYMFDDLYSYASIVDIRIHENDEDCIQTCVLKVTNMFNKLSNIVSDSQNYEDYFISGPSADSAINAILLKPGCKIKLQLGYTPIFTEKNTKFVGEITNIQFGEITTIEAQSYGATLHTSISEENVELISPDRTGHGIEKKDTERLSVSSKLKLISAGVLDKITSYGKLQDFTINPDLAVIPDEELLGTDKNEDKKIRNRLISFFNESSNEVFGTDVALYYNRQLMENVTFRSKDLDTIYNGLPGLIDKLKDRIGKTFGSLKNDWLCYNESGWDVLNEINRLLPNYHLSTRPYGTRSTLVWGPDDGYYKYKRSINYNSLASTRLLEFCNTVERNSKLPNTGVEFVLKLFDNVRGSLEGGDLFLRLIFRNANIMFESFCEIDKPIGYRSGDNITYESTLSEHINWFINDGLSNNININKELVRSANYFDKTTQSIYKKIKKLKDGEETQVRKIAVSRVGSMNQYNAKSLKTFCVALIAEEMFEYIKEIASERSSSFKKISNSHVKLSGRDIIKNNIILAQPNNMIKLTVPPDDAKNLETVNPSSDNITYDIPIHFKLKPFVYNPIAAYFKNVNILPDSRTSVISSVCSSYFVEMMNHMYDGDIYMLLDPEIYPNDKIFLHDYNNDYFGMVGVKSHDIIVNAEEGAISIIKPKMLAKSNSNLNKNVLESSMGIIGIGLRIAAIGAALYIGRKFATKVVKNFKIKAAINKNSVPAQALSKFDDLMGKLKGLKGENNKSVNKFAKSISSITDSKFGQLPNRGLRKLVERTANLLGNKNLKPITKVLNDLPAAQKTEIGEIVAKYASNYKDFDTDVLIKQVKKVAGKDKFFYENNKFRDDIVAMIKQAAETSSINAAQKYSAGASKYILNTSESTVDDLAKEYYNLYQKELRKSLTDSITLGYVDDLDNITAEELNEVRDLVDKLIGPSGGLLPNTNTAVSRKITENFTKNHNTFIKDVTQAEAKIEDIARSSMNSKDANDFVELFVKHQCDDGYMWDIVKNVGIDVLKIFAPLTLASTFYEMSRDVINYVLVTIGTRDTVTISPLWCRGEPFVAGLDGINKQDLADSGLWSVLKARFTNFVDGLEQLNDPYQEAKYKYLVMKRQGLDNSEISGIINE